MSLSLYMLPYIGDLLKIVPIFFLLHLFVVSPILFSLSELFEAGLMKFTDNHNADKISD